MSMGPLDRREAQIFAFEELRADIQYEILRALKEEGISQSDLAKRLGCSPPWISQFLDDDANLTLESVSKVFLALGKRLVVATEPHECARDEDDAEVPAKFDEVPAKFDEWVSRDLYSSAEVSDASASRFVHALLRAYPINEEPATVNCAVNDNYADAEMEAA